MKKINITDIQTISKPPLYVLVAGAIGAGKSYIVNKYLSDLHIIDIDENTLKLGNGVYDGANVRESMTLTFAEVKAQFKKNESFVQQGTSANLQSTINKMKLAKEYGFTTILLLIDTDPKQAYINATTRVDRNNISSTKIKRTYGASKSVFNFMNDEITDMFYAEPILEKLNMTAHAAQTLTDYTIHYKNIR